MARPIVTQFENGLRAVLLEQHTAPVAAFCVWYRVGSRNEVHGWTGISHWVEHMLFKGTPAHPKDLMTRAIDRLGGIWNAFTWKDYTAYHEVLPAQHLGFVIAMETDRMRSTLFDPAEVESERTVIISEREGAENFPSFYLHEEVDALAFKVHPYRQPVIGWKSDLRRITRDDLYAHYQTYYQPSNATVVAVGAFGADEVLDQIRRAFGDLPAGPPVPTVRAEEPSQEGERRVIVQRQGGATSYLQMAFHAVRAADAAFPACLVLDAVLGGFGSIRGLEDGGATRSSRLYRGLVDRGLATEVASALIPAIDPSLLRISATVRSGVPVAAVEEAVLEQLDRLTKEEVGEGELSRVKRQASAQLIYARDGVHGLALTIGAYAMVDQPEAFFDLQARIDRVTPADVQRTAAEVFRSTQRTVGWYLPLEAAATAAPAAAHRPGAPA